MLHLGWVTIVTNKDIFIPLIFNNQFPCLSYRRICSVVTIWIEQYPRDFDEPTDYVSLNQLIHFCKQRLNTPVVKKLYQLCEGKLNTLTVSPFEDESKTFVR